MNGGEFLAGWCVGVVVTAPLAWSYWKGWAKQHVCPDPSAHELSADDHEVIAASFATHTAAVHRQVAEYGDVLAGEDAVLRERLRRFERGDQ